MDKLRLILVFVFLGSIVLGLSSLEPVKELENQQIVSASDKKTLSLDEQEDNNELNNSAYKVELNESYNKTASERYVKKFFRKDGLWKKEKQVEINHSSMVYEIDRFAMTKIEEVHLKNAWKIYDETYKQVKSRGWFELDKAEKDGFNNPYSIDHYVNLKYYRDNETLNPEKPEFLMFMNNSNGTPQIVGVMFMVNSVNKEGRQVGGSLTKWHYHAYPKKTCFYNGYPVNKSKNCPERYKSDKSPEMMHVWFIENKDGVFGTKMSVPQKSVDAGIKKMNKSQFMKENRQMNH